MPGLQINEALRQDYNNTWILRYCERDGLDTCFLFSSWEAIFRCALIPRAENGPVFAKKMEKIIIYPPRVNKRSYL